MKFLIENHKLAEYQIKNIRALDSDSKIYYKRKIGDCIKLPPNFYLVSQPFPLSKTSVSKLPKLKGFHKQKISRLLFKNNNYVRQNTELYSPFVVEWTGSIKEDGAIFFNNFADQLFKRRQTIPILDVSSKGLAGRFAKEVWNWGLTGFSNRPEWLVNDLLKHCTTCPFYAKLINKGKCELCGCDLRPYKSKNKNKLLWSSTHCPLDPPTWF